MSDNWIVGNLQSAFNTWNDKLTEIWSLVTTSPQAFRGGAIWTTIVTINDALKAIGCGLLVLFFAMIRSVEERIAAGGLSHFLPVQSHF